MANYNGRIKLRLLVDSGGDCETHLFHRSGLCSSVQVSKQREMSAPDTLGKQYSMQRVRTLVTTALATLGAATFFTGFLASDETL
jgi:hypothetical protein